MSQPDPHQGDSNKSLHTPSIVQRLVSAYKLWDGFRTDFPKKSRYTIGAKIEILFLDTIELLFTASYVAREQKQPILAKASAKLDLLKLFLQIAWEIKALENSKYAGLSESLNEIGRMLGGWMKGAQKETPPRSFGRE